MFYNVLRGEVLEIKDAIVARINEICNQRNINYNELATLAGVTPSTVYSMMDETRRDLSVITVKKLCDGLEVEIPEFFASEIFYSLEQEIK